jgi:hypothetical protein
MAVKLAEVAAACAKALRISPCTCIDVGSWPLFKAEAVGKHQPKVCARCRALAEYDAFVSIVQTPGKEPKP